MFLYIVNKATNGKPLLVRTYAAQDVRKKDKEAVRKQSEFDKSEKARLLIKSKKNYAWKT